MQGLETKIKNKSWGWGFLVKYFTSIGLGEKNLNRSQPLTILSFFSF